MLINKFLLKQLMLDGKLPIAAITLPMSMLLGILQLALKVLLKLRLGMVMGLSEFMVVMVIQYW